jgi:MFS transporter, DHA2 family, multidrug resistance protein
MSNAGTVSAPAAPSIPWYGLTAVLMGTFVSTLNGRLSSFGVADIRGALHAGFDEGAWITTAQSVGQMLVVPVAIWVGSIYGPRRVLFEAAVAFGVISVLLPLAPNFPVFLALQFASGLASGFFIPLTLSFLLRSTPPPYWAWGIAIYALNLELSLNIAASLEAWYIDHLNWHWIFWQNVPLAAIMAACLHFGVARDPVNPSPPRGDWYGFASGGIGLGLIYAALDQGNRLDWLNSGLVCGLLVAGTILMVAFLANEMRTDHPGANLKIVFSGPLPRLLMLVAFLRLTLLATAYLIPQYLQVVRGFRSLEVGQSLLWLAVPQLIFCPLAALMLRRTDPRVVTCIGFLFISTACLIVAHSMTPEWGPDQFLRTQLLQAMGQSFALSGILFYSVLHLKPEDALTFGAGIQTARLMGGELGLALVVTLARVRGQIGSNHIGTHVRSGSEDVIGRLHAYGDALGRGDPVVGSGRALDVLALAVHSMSIMQGIMDMFVVLGFFTAVALIFVVAQKQAPVGPASHKPLFPRKEEVAA